MPVGRLLLADCADVIPPRGESAPPIALRPLGATGLNVSEVGFGAGMVAGMFLRGSPEYLVEAVQKARALGINHFDTAPQYGDGASEANLGRVLQALRVPERGIVLGTKVEFYAEHIGRWQERVLESVEESLERLRRDCVDVLYLHNPLSNGGSAHGVFGAARPLPPVTVSQVLAAGGVADALEGARVRGLARFIGFTAVGDADAANVLVASGRFQAVQACYSVLNPSAGLSLPAGSPLHDFRQVMCHAGRRGLGAVAFRVLAGGAVIGPAARRGLAGTTSSQAMHGVAYEDEEVQARALAFLLEGEAEDMPEVALRFALGNPCISSALVGFSAHEHIAAAAAACRKGPLSAAVVRRIEALWASGFRGAPQRGC